MDKWTVGPDTVPITVLSIDNVLGVVEGTKGTSSDSFRLVYRVLPVVELPAVVETNTMVTTEPSATLADNPGGTSDEGGPTAIGIIGPILPPTSAPIRSSVWTRIKLMPGVTPVRMTVRSSGDTSQTLNVILPFVGPTY